MSAPQYPQSPDNQSGGYPQAGGDPQSGGYPDQPYPGNYPGSGYSGPPAAPAVKPKAPGTVTAAFIIYLLSAISALASVLLLLTGNGEQQLRQALADTNTSGIDQETLFNTTRAVVIAVAVILLVLYVVFDFVMRAGRNWARIVLTVLSALSIVSSFSGSLGAARGATSWIGLILSVLAIVLMYLPQSNAYFAAAKLARQRV